MTSFLVATLYAPLASWGEIAVGGVRGSRDRPTRSAVLGLIAASLGVARDEQDAHDALDRGYGLAVRMDSGGSQLVDFHTAQTVSASVVRAKRPTTRRELLEAGDRQTIVSTRSLRQDSMATIALWMRADVPWSLERVCNALKRPAFVLCAGRKANALGAPLAPQIIEAPTLSEVFERRAGLRGEPWDLLRPTGGWGREVSFDATEQVASGFVTERTEVRRDGNPDRERWQFRDRLVHVAILPSERAT